MSSNPNSQFQYWLTVFIAFFVTGLATIAIWYFFGAYPNSKFSELEQAGQYGDSYGFVNSLLSSLVLAGAIVAIILQTLELRLQRIETNESQEHWKASAIAQKASTEALRQQMVQFKDQAEATTLLAYTNALAITSSKSKTHVESNDAVLKAHVVARQLKKRIEAILDTKIPDLSFFANVKYCIAIAIDSLVEANRIAESNEYTSSFNYITSRVGLAELELETMSFYFDQVKANAVQYGNSWEGFVERTDLLKSVLSETKKPIEDLNQLIQERFFNDENTISSKENYSLNSLRGLLKDAIDKCKHLNLSVPENI